MSLTLDAEGKIASLTVGDDDFNETNGLGSKVREEAFTSQFIGMAVPVKAADVELVSGATVSSEAVIEAINKATEGLSAPEGEARQGSASAEGFRSPVAVSLTLAGDNTISALTIGDRPSQTKGPGDKVLEDALSSSSWQGCAAEAEDIDLVTGATDL